MSGTAVEVTVGSRTLALSNLHKVLWPATGTTKGELVDYYARVAPAMVPHLAGRPITMHRYPNGVEEPSFYEKNCPSHRPTWLPTVQMGRVQHCCIDEPAALVWAANLASIEIHPSLATCADLDRPRSVVFDLDPGAPAGVLDCARVAFTLSALMERLGLRMWAKTSGSKGLQLYVPLNSQVSYATTKPFALAVAQLLERDQPGLVVSSQDRSRRAGKVLIDWSQNTASKTTVSVYSVRARAEPTVSTPLAWDELEDALASSEPGRLVFDMGQVLDRVERHGDMMAEVLSCTQELPDFKPN